MKKVLVLHFEDGTPVDVISGYKKLLENFKNVTEVKAQNDYDIKEVREAVRELSQLLGL